MPILQWIGKEKVVNHHLEVPCHVLSRTYSFDEEGQKAEDNGSENMVIHGDNLLALKSLLPKYEGRVKCIYIDPPYNTGNEGWVYNDAVNDPVIKRWLGEVVGKEGEDLSRHDKWLCMMYPRLRLLQRLLSDDGAIFISIDTTELSNLMQIANEIFGEINFVDCISWLKKASPSNDAKYFSNDIEYIIVYAKNKVEWHINRLPLTEKQLKNYKNPDNDPRGAWNSATYTCNKSKDERPSLYYPILNPNTGKEVYPKETAVWAYSKEQYKKHVEHNLLYWGATGKAQYPRFKKFLSGHQGVVNRTLWHYDDVNHTQGASLELKAIGIDKFDTPKPTRLIQRILQIATDKDSIILDSFAGSGTTAHAVLKQNAEDGGNRKFILIEMGDYADSITAERVKRVIHGYGEGKKAVSGTGGDFSFYELGAPLMKDGFLNEDASEKAIRDYVYFMDTRENRAQEKADEPYFLGTHQGAAYYFYYKKGEATVLSYDFLATVKTEAESYVMYADSCLLLAEELSKYHITFKKIPRDIARL